MKFLYSNLSSAYKSLGLSPYLRCSSSANELKPSSFFYLKVGEVEIPTFKDILNNTILIYPTFAIIYKGSNDITITDLKSEKRVDNVYLLTLSEEYTEYDTSVHIPYNADIVGYEWKYMTKKGEPDGRYSDNPKYTRFKRCFICLHPYPSCHIFTTSFKEAENLKNSLSDLVEGDLNRAISRTLVDKDAVDGRSSTQCSETNMLRKYISEDKSFIEIVRYVVKQEIISVSALQRKFAIGYNRACKYIDWLESLDFVSTPVNMTRKVLVDEEYINLLLKDDEDSEVLPLQKQKDKSNDVDKFKSKSIARFNATKELDSLIGLAEVKEEINKLKNFIKIQLVRQSQGLKTSPISYHCVFTGNPGTGKTTVARIVAEIYRDLGILKKGHLIETDRSGLVAEYVGQTANKTNKVIDSAIDGVLFIDEAYSLAPSSSNDFGHEAIATLLKRMEDDRDRLVVILAGYGNEMQNFINANPGLQSRFNRYIHFDDYSADDLMAIFELNLKKHQYIISDTAKTLLKSYFNNAVRNKDKNFGNGRYVRNVFESTLQNQATRLSTNDSLSKEDLQLIEAEDIPAE